MAMNRSKSLFGLSKIILLPITIFVIGVGLPSCGDLSYPTPTFQDEPRVIDIEDLLQEYEANPVQAEEEHAGRTYLFPAVEVDEVLSTVSDPEAYQLGAAVYLASGQVQFRPRYVYDLDEIGPGFVVDVLGEVSGWTQGTFYVINCTYTIAEGGDLPPPGIY